MSRCLLGLGGRAEWLTEGLTLTVEVRNLLNKLTVSDNQGGKAPLRDFEGFPLPGRSVYATLRYRI